MSTAGPCLALVLALACTQVHADDLAQAYSAMRLGEFSRAAVLFKKQASAGNTDAQYQLGKLYLAGRGLDQDNSQARRWLELAAQEEDSNAQYALALHYLDEGSISLGRRWLERSAANGNSRAQRELSESPGPEEDIPALSDEKNWLRAATACRVQDLAAQLRTGTDVQLRDQQQRNALYYQVACGSAEGADLLISHGIAVDNEDTFGSTALMLAVQRGDLNLTRLLLQAGANSRVISPSGDSLLDLAVQRKHDQTAALLKSKGARHSAQWTAVSSISGKTALNYLSDSSTSGSAANSWPTAVQAAIQDEAQLLAAMLQNNRSDLLAHEDKRRRTLLMYATEAASSATIKLLAESGAQLDQRNINNKSALTLAAKAGDTETAVLLMSLGADPATESPDGADAVLQALAAGHDGTALVILKNYGAEHIPEPSRQRYLMTAIQTHATASRSWLLQDLGRTDLLDSSERTLLWYASRHCDIEAMDKLLHLGSDVDAPDLNRYSTLHAAAGNACLPGVSALIQARATVDARTRSGNTPLMLAIRARHNAVVSLLLEKGADASLQNAAGDTPLLLAVNAGSPELVAHLLEFGGDPYRRNELGQSAIEIAQRQHPDIEELIKSKGGFKLFRF